MASDGDIKSEFLKSFTIAEQAWLPVVQRFKHNYDVYLNNDKKRKEEQKNDKLYVHHVYQQIETIVPRMVTPDPRWDVSAREGQSDIQSKLVQKKLDYDMEMDDFVSKQSGLAKTMLICGIGVAKVIWVKKARKVKVHDWNVSPMDLLAGKSPVREEDRIERNGPSMVPVNLFDFFPDPGATSIEQCREVYHRVWLTEEDIKERMALKGSDGNPIYKNLDKVLEGGPGGSDEVTRLANESGDAANARRRTNRYEFIERWRGNRLTVLVNREHIVRDGDNPYWHGKIPFVAAATQPDIDSFVGISEVEVIENIQRMIHKFENLRMRAAEFSIAPVIKVHRSLKNAQNLRWEPGAIIYVDRNDQIMPEVASSNTQVGWSETQAYLSYMQQVSGVSPFIAGADPSVSGVNQETATGASILKEEANKRLALKLLQVQQMYTKVGKMFVELNQQFLTKPELIKVVGIDGETWETIEPQDIAGSYQIKVANSTDSLARSAENDRLNQAIQTLMPMQGYPLGDGTAVDIKYVMTRLLENIGVDPEKCFVQAPPQMPQEGQPVEGSPAQA